MIALRQLGWGLVLTGVMSVCCHAETLCTATDWHQLGQDMGNALRPQLIPVDLEETCRNQQATPDLAQFAAGYQQGLSQRCAPPSAYALSFQTRDARNNSCQLCPSLELANGCWQASILGAELGRLAEEMGNYLQLEGEYQLRLNAAQENLQHLKDLQKLKSPVSVQQLSGAETQVFVSTSALKGLQRYHKPQQSGAINRLYKGCLADFATSSPEQYQNCKQGLARYQQQLAEQKALEQAKSAKEPREFHFSE